MAAGSDALQAYDVALFDKERVVEVVDCRADVAGQQVNRVADAGHRGSIGGLHRQMLFARLQGRPLRMPNDDASGNPCVRRNTFVASIAGKHVWQRLADNG